MVEERTEITRAEGVSSLLLWYGLLAGPIGWAAQLLLDYGLEEAVVCAPGSGPGTEIWSLGIETVIQIINGAATAFTLLALGVSYRCYRRLSSSDATEAGRARWMATGGIFISAIFLVITVMKFAPPFFLDPCISPL